MRRLMLELLLGVTLIIIGVPILLAAGCGRSLLYHPTKLSPSERRALAARPGWQEAPLRVSESVQLVGLLRPAEQGKSWLLFFGGNAMGLVASQSLLHLVAGNDAYGLAGWAYRGYDGSDGKPTEANLTDDAIKQAEYLFAEQNVEPGRLILIGQSLGTGVAVQLAAALNKKGAPPAGVVLLSPYRSIAQVFDDNVPLIPVGWAAADTYRSDRFLPSVAGPVLVIHGADDSLITPDHGRAVAAALGEKAQLLELPGRGHNDLWEDLQTVKAIRSFVAEATSKRAVDSSVEGESTGQPASDP